MRISVVGAVAVTAGVAMPAAADIPTPKVDYSAQVRLAEMEKPVTMRHKDGVMRMEMDMEGEPAVFLFDTRKGTGTMLLGGEDGKMAMEVGAAGGPVRLPKAGSKDGTADARKTGTDRVAGHACNVWSYTDPATKATDTACITDDGILLRSTATVDGKRTTVLEAISLDRKTQAAALFTVPTDYQRVSVPAMSGMPNR
ncbi:MAG TPA: hypothetical protein VD978_33020 [Azospirillum sp.]|nr:hypothetical protein [Azospirillum sp.]